MEINQAIHSSGNLHILKPRKALNKAFLKVKPNRSQIESFKHNLIELLDRTNDTESEEFHKNLVTDFLKKTYYDPNHFINTKGRNDLVIHNGNKAKSSVGVIIEAKKPTNRAEMLSKEKINVKAFQELVLYYLRERITQKNLEVKYVIATNINEWFIFDANVFEKAFAQNKKLVAQFTDFEGGRLAGKSTDFFYKEIAEPFIAEMQQEVEFTYFDIRNYDKPLRNNNPKDDNKLIALYKLLSPEHLLKLPFTNDSNSLDKRFYGELLHIIGLTETKQGGKKLIERRKEGYRNTGSFLENAIIQLDSMDKIGRLENPSQFGDTMQEKLFNVGLELSITWLNRILFLKLLEAQLLTYHKGDRSYEFLSLDRIHNYDDLNSLFFQVLARKYEERNEDVKALFEKVPYLNSSLFEPTDIEHATLFISNLRDDKTLPIYSATVLKDKKGKKRSGELNALEYLFEFLNAYDFSSEGGEAIQEDNKTLINASVLGLIFEKINGYKDGSFFTPGFITMYMCRETIRKAVVQKFNESPLSPSGSPQGGVKVVFNTLEDVYDQIDNNRMFTRQEANDIINSLKICDPAVGSGHFLVSALNEMIAIKNDLNILQDRTGRRLKEYQVEVVNDELIVTDEDGELFEYNPTSKESQRVQETLFHEKQQIIENCLFGVDINPNSVKICRLRLWIELLKSAYYKSDVSSSVPIGTYREPVAVRELETLPNIDINIKCGNSLISRFDLDADLSKALKDSKWNIDSYRNAVDTYRNAHNKEQKREMEKIIHDIKNDFRSEISSNDPKVKRHQKVKGELFMLTNQTQMFEMGRKEKAAWNKKLEKLSKESKKLEIEIREIKDNKIYENAFEWRFEFPEVLDDKGNYVGFDVVIGNPPYIPLEEFDDSSKNYFRKEYSLVERKYETSVLFMIIGLRICGKKRSLSYIAPVTWETGENYTLLREKLFTEWGVSKIINLPFDIFADAYVDTGIFFLENKPVSHYKIHSFKKNDDHNELRDIPFTLIKSNLVLEPKFKIILNPLVFEIVRRLNREEFEKLGDISISTQGLSPSRFPRLTESDSSFSFPYLSKGNVYSYVLEVDETYITSLKNMESLLPFYLEGEKILIRRIINRQDRLTIGFTDKKMVFKKDINPFIITKESFDPRYVLGVLASKFISYYYINVSAIALKDDFRQTTLTELREIMIPIIHPQEQENITKKVNEILLIKTSDGNADTSSLEAEIDQLVYRLYGLSEEEIRIVENL